MTVSIVPIVEGHAEVESVPILLRRVLEKMGRYDVVVARPFRVKRYRVVKEGEMERAIQLAVRDREQVDYVLVLLDADDDCPKDLGLSLLKRCKAATHLPTAVVLANREFEAWFLGAKESLGGICGIRRDAETPADPERIRGAKEHLTKNMEQGRRYIGVDDQPPLAERMDLEKARQRCRSFDKLVRDVESLIGQRGRESTR
jgi:hypothetical protein